MSSFLIVGTNKSKRRDHAATLIGTNSTGIDLVVFEEPTSIAEAREVKSSLTRRPYQSDRISVILAEADQLTPEAQNALLKTLEEPPGRTDLYLLVQDRESLLPTVRSRTQLIDLGPLEPSVSAQELEQAWKAYQANSLAKLWATSLELGPVVWAELGRQLLLYKLSPNLLTTTPQLTDFVSTDKLTEITNRLDQAKLQQFLSLAQQASSDLAAHVNRKLILENLTLTLHQIR